jgi:hypothetical protein
MVDEPEIRAANPGDLEAAIDLLVNAALPVADLTTGSSASSASSGSAR